MQPDLEDETDTDSDIKQYLVPGEEDNDNHPTDTEEVLNVSASHISTFIYLSPAIGAF